jgi:hypothetical protein
VTKPTKMTVAQAAKVWLELHPRQRQLKTATEVLKEHFRRTGRTRYRNLIGYSVSTYRGLDTDLVRKELGSKVAGCEVERTRETLSAL